MISNAMLMTAGLGTRLRPFTDLLPKPLLPVMGVPVAQFGIDLAVQAGVKRISANVHHLSEKARTGLLGLDRGKSELVISDESRLLLGSSGGLRKALEIIGEQPFFLINGDIMCDVDLKGLAARHAQLRKDHGVTLTLTVFEAGPPGGTYREILVDQKTGLIGGTGQLEKGKPYFVGVAVIEPDAIRHLPLDQPSEFVPSVLTPAIQGGKAGAFLTEGTWFDVGSPTLWMDAHISLLKGMENNRIPAAWKKRIAQSNQRIQPEVWVSNASQSVKAAESWTGPCFWSGISKEDQPPTRLGPSAVLYGEAPAAQNLTRGIGFDGIWHKLD